MKSSFLPLLGLLVSGSACSTANPIPLTSAALEEAEISASAGDWKEAWNLINDFDSEDLDRATMIDFHRLCGEIAWELEEVSRCIRHYESFLQMRGPGSDSRVAEERLFKLGNEMLEGEHRTMGLFPNRTRGRVTLQNLAGWAPESPLAPEALATVAEYSYSNGHYKDAAVDYQLLLSRYRASEWGDLATFRLGMCGFHRAHNSKTNLQLLSQSSDQMANYQKLYPSGRYATEAAAAILELLELQAGYFLYLGDYYMTVGNPAAARRYYERAATHSGTQSAMDASNKMQTIPVTSPEGTPSP